MEKIKVCFVVQVGFESEFVLLNKPNADTDPLQAINSGLYSQTLALESAADSASSTTHSVLGACPKSPGYCWCSAVYHAVLCYACLAS